MQTAGLSGSADIAELANGPNYSHLPKPVNIVIAFLSVCGICGCVANCPMIAIWNTRGTAHSRGDDFAY
jgi:hypothetical protein